MRGVDSLADPRELGRHLAGVSPGLRIVARGVLGQEARIDFVGVDPSGAVVLALVGEAGEDLVLVARGLAQRAWVQERLRDWNQLAPDLGMRPDAGVRVLLLCPAFGPESRAAARALGDDAPLLVHYRREPSDAPVNPLLEPLEAPAVPVPDARAPGPLFRTGLTDALLDLDEDEKPARPPTAADRRLPAGHRGRHFSSPR
jgi:hypothetical protein